MASIRADRCKDMILDLVSDKVEVKKDRYHDAIVGAFETLHSMGWERIEFSELYPWVCTLLGASLEDAMKGWAPDPYSETGALKDIKGFIRSWVEERSPDSRQRYFRGGKRVVWGLEERPLLFINEKLRAQNTAIEWKPYNHVRGNGWIYDPIRANNVEPPSYYILQVAASLCRRQGMRGRTHTASTRDQVSTYRVVNPAKVVALTGVVVATAVVASFG